MLALLIKVRDWLYVAVIAGGVAFWFYHDHVEQAAGAAKVVAAVQVATAKAEKAAEARITILNQQYASELAKVQGNYETQLSLATAQHSADLQRLRDADSKGGSNTAVESPGASVAGSNGGAESAGGLGSVLETVALELADAVRHDDAQLQQCWAERDSLTGK